VSGGWTLVADSTLHEQLFGHLFPGDNDEHGAIITAGVAQSPRGTRLLARELWLARDGIDYIPGKYGYRRLAPEFVNRAIRHCRDERLAYLAVHNHDGHDHVDFSPDDLRSHQRGYPALLDIARGQPVGALVLARNALAGDIWTPDRARRPIAETVVLGRRVQRIYPAPPPLPPGADHTFDRQARLFGDRGQYLLGRLKVGVIGCGGVGMILVALLARLGVGELVVVDPERIDPTNLPRLPDASTLDAMLPLHRLGLHALAERLAAPKIRRARRIARRANHTVTFHGIRGNVIDPNVAAHLLDCDFLFLAADSHQARRVFNAISHQYLIPGFQLGTKIPVDPASGAVGDIQSNVRLVLPQRGCLRCNQLISPARLQEEALTEQERKAQRYVDEVPAASVITFNALVAAQAATDFLLMNTGLTHDHATTAYLRYQPRKRTLTGVSPRRDLNCPDCGTATRSRRARGDERPLRLRQKGTRPEAKEPGTV
jgi:molybdopterin/thiamine biosynthesis adenylyltransferase